jgi:kinesin family protein 6/9
MSGGGVRWEERGIIPRTFSHLFDEINKLKGKTEYRIHGSYLEIYNECGYDLLDEQHANVEFEKWNKITLFGDS